MKSCIRFLAVLLVGSVPSLNSVVVVAHPGHEHTSGNEGQSESAAESVDVLSDTDRLWLELRQLQVEKLNTEPNIRWIALQTRDAQAAGRPAIARFFDPFKKQIGVRWDEDYLYVESNGLPSHNMMVGITAWQQQVPFPQPFVGSNAWQIPLHPVPARNPMSAKTNFFRGAIALAVNGVPIFNPIKNDGRTDTLLAGELDQWGGHCGRADDYHYHIAPVHLEETVGKGKPLAFALDGYPIYGYEEADGSKPKGLDQFNGHKDSAGNYHYHATKTYPYLNGGFYGEVVERGGQVDPQPRSQSLRPATAPLRGAKITGFAQPKPNSYRIEYDVYGNKRSISYDLADDGSAEFRFTNRSGMTTETFRPRQSPGARQGDGTVQRENLDRDSQNARPGERPLQSDGRGQSGGGGRDPILRFDRNRDGVIDRDELARAPEVIGLFDLNNDGKITSEELQGDNEDRSERPGAARDPKEPPQGDGPRQPWILVHASEVDLNDDGVISREEIVEEAEKAFDAYDQNDDGKLVEAELNNRGSSRSAMGGFIRGHAKELDRDGDGVLTRKEVLDNAARMFSRLDTNGDGKATKAEQEASRRSGDADETERGGEVERRRDELKNNGPRQKQSSTTSDSSPSRLSAFVRDQADEDSREGAKPQRNEEGVRTRPNFVFVLIDDMGWRDMGFSGNAFAETPHTDRLAREGLIFSQAYSSAPNCAPSRACLMSGQYPPRHGIYTVVDERHAPGSPHHRIIAADSKEAMDTDVVTIAECFKDAGYATAAFGMWNLGRGRSGPSTATGQGFDIYRKPQDLGFEQHSYFDGDGRFITDAFTDLAIEFVESNKDSPFFLYLPYHAIHAPFEPKRELVQKYERKAREIGDQNADPVYAAMIDAVDQNVGRLMDTLKKLNLDDNTMVVFTSDNGGTPQHVAPLNGSKGALYEGGIRVPACVWWSGINNLGRVSDTPILGMDFYPTMLAAAGIQLPPNQIIDGASFLPVLQDSGSVDRDAVFWHFPSYVGRGSPSSAIRMGDWKLIENFEDRSVELFNLADDIGEHRNLAATMPAKTEELHTRLASWQRSTGAAIPSESNPSFDTTSVRRSSGGGRNGRSRGSKKN